MVAVATPLSPGATLRRRAATHGAAVRGRRRRVHHGAARGRPQDVGRRALRAGTGASCRRRTGNSRTHQRHRLQAAPQGQH